MQRSLPVSDASPRRQRTANRLFVAKGDCALKRMGTGIVIQAAMFQNSHKMGAWQIDHAAILWADVLEWHPERELCMIIFRI
jgi:hypothetical protein